MVRADVMTA